MTENEAIKEFQQNIDMPFGSNISIEASELAIQALEEQIPKKPARKLRSGMSNDYKDYYCACGRFIGYKPEVHNYLENGTPPFSYCCDCGQKFDWSDEENE